MIKAIAILNAVCLLIVILTAAVEIPTFNPSFYIAEYDKYGIPDHIQVSKADMGPVTDRLLAYMKGKAPDLVIETTVAEQLREFFNQREKDHMVDVRNLILGGFLLRNIAAAIIVVSLIVFCLIYTKPRGKWLMEAARAVKWVFAIFLAVAAVIVALIASNFDRAFTIFHEMFFNNSLWILDPNTDLLVNIVPLGFFMDISRTIAIIFITFCVAAIVLSTVVYNKMNKKIKRA